MFSSVYRAQDPLEAELVISLFRVAGLHPLDLQMSHHVSLAGADLYYFVKVPDDEIESAIEVLKANGYA